MIGTNKRFFFSVDSEMVEEVAPLSELFAALGELAFHESTDSFGVPMLISQDFVKAGVRNVLALAKGMESLSALEPIFLGHYLPYFQLVLH